MTRGGDKGKGKEGGTPKRQRNSKKNRETSFIHTYVHIYACNFIHICVYMYMHVYKTFCPMETSLE